MSLSHVVVIYYWDQMIQLFSINLSVFSTKMILKFVCLDLYYTLNNLKNVIGFCLFICWCAVPCQNKHLVTDTTAHALKSENPLHS